MSGHSLIFSGLVIDLERAHSHVGFKHLREGV